MFNRGTSLAKGIAPKFLIADNPRIREEYNDERLWIIHLRYPLFVAEVMHFDDEKNWMRHQSMHTTGASLHYGPELVSIGVIWIEPNDLTAGQLAKLMSRTGDWYHSYLVWEDDQIEGN
jgi:hypothetical protein